MVNSTQLPTIPLPILSPHHTHPSPPPSPSSPSYRSKVGGLADVLCALPAALADRGHHVMTVAPLYDDYQDVFDTGASVPLCLPDHIAADSLDRLTNNNHEEEGEDTEDASSTHSSSINNDNSNRKCTSNTKSASSRHHPKYAQLYMCSQGGVDRVFVNHPLLRGGIYGSGGNNTYCEAGDDEHMDVQYSILCQAALAAPVLLWNEKKTREHQQQQNSNNNSKDSARVIFVGNDWPTALLMMYLVYNIRLQASLAAAAAAGNNSSSRREQDGGNDDDDRITTIAPALHESIPLNFPANHLKLLIKHLYSSLGAFCIHNLAYQGTFPTSVFSRLGLPLVALPALRANSDWSADVLPIFPPLLLPPQKQSPTFTTTANQEEGAKDTYRALESAVALWPTDTEEEDDENHWCGNRYLSPTMATVSMKGSSSPTSSNDGKGVGQRTVPSSIGQMLKLTDEQRQLIENALIDATTTITNSTCESSTINFMRGALLASDRILTVSPGYASEISTKEAVACGLGDIVSAKGIVGIMNGIDTVEWNPETDTWLPEGLRFDGATAAEKKAQLKAQLQERLGLKIDPEVPMFGFVGRLTQQKGVDVLMAAAPALLAGDSWIPRPVALSELTTSSSSSITKSTAAVGQEPEGDGIGAPSPGVKQNKTASTISGAQLQLVVLGTGDTWLEAALSGLELSFKGSAAGMPSFSEELAHWVIAASDFIIVPSRYEPCGLVAQCAVRYGSVPVVAAVGGLRDLVSPDIGYTLPGPGVGNNQDCDTAATMRQNVQNLVETVKLASKEWKSDKYNNMQKNCMELDVSWKGPAAEWEQMLSDML